jgi:hypothetical protein
MTPPTDGYEPCVLKLLRDTNSVTQLSQTRCYFRDIPHKCASTLCDRTRYAFSDFSLKT